MITEWVSFVCSIKLLIIYHYLWKSTFILIIPRFKHVNHHFKLHQVVVEHMSEDRAPLLYLLLPVFAAPLAAAFHGIYQLGDDALERIQLLIRQKMHLYHPDALEIRWALAPVVLNVLSPQTPTMPEHYTRHEEMKYHEKIVRAIIIVLRTFLRNPRHQHKYFGSQG